MNPKALEELGKPRMPMEESMRASMAGGAYVFSRWVIGFSGEKITTRMDSVFRLGEGFQWGWCEGEGTGRWAGNQLSLPGGVGTKGQSGFVSRDDFKNGSCNANVAGGIFTLEQQDGETRLRGSRDGADFAFVLVKDESDAKVEERARSLAGNPKK